MKRTAYIPIMLTAVLAAACRLEPQLTADNIPQVVSAMTLEEKVHLVTGVSIDSPEDSILIASVEKPAGCAGFTWPVPRLGIPSVFYANSPAGVAIQGCHSRFPIGCQLASSWDRELIESVGEAIGDEALESGIDMMLAPSMNIQRNALGGRNFDYYSEDPLVSGLSAAAFINGLQSSNVGASLKHFAVSNQVSSRRENDACVTQRTLREIYLRGFRIAIARSHPWSVLSSYNKINGIFASESGELLTTILRDEWGYDGMVISNYAAPGDAVAKMLAGNDLLNPGSDYREVLDAVREGTLPEEILDRNVSRILEMIVKTPTFRGNVRQDRHDGEDRSAVARKAAADGMVLLENRDTTLPFAPEIKKVALYGEASYNTCFGGTGSCNVLTDHNVTVAEGLLLAGYDIEKECGTDNADAAVITIGRVSSESVDVPLADFSLSREERSLLERVCGDFHAKGKRVVVLLNIGHPIEVAGWRELPDAVLLMWQGGMESGNAVADILSGAVNPSGRLTMTFPINYTDDVSSSNFPINDGVSKASKRRGKEVRDFDYTFYQEGIYVGYRYFDSFNVDVAYPFGYGLGYTSFQCDEPEVIARKKSLKVYVNVTNIGSVAGREVVQLYVSAPRGSVEKPRQELKGYAKTPILAPGESCVVTMTVPFSLLASFNEPSFSWITDPGTYIFKVGTSSRDIRSETAVDIDEKYCEQVHDVLNLTQPLNELRRRRSIFREKLSTDTKDGANPRGAKRITHEERPDNLVLGRRETVDTVMQAADTLTRAAEPEVLPVPEETNGAEHAAEGGATEL
ncbi:MAG: glycoside hydrolase family 3 C-terminal domain-containing protein [Bacteroidales bacterium]|nr:glycoside hydrolase family 3 C-terminal domain-containing protein [Bacteroidales bacterium]